MPHIMQNTQMRSVAANQAFENPSSDFEKRFRFHPHPLRSNPTYPLPVEESDGTTDFSVAAQAQSPTMSTCLNEICTQPQSSDLIECAVFDTTDPSPSSLQSTVAQPVQLTLIQTANQCSPLLCHERVSPILDDQRATTSIRRYSIQPTLSAISDRSDHIHANLQNLKSPRKELRIITTIKDIDISRKEYLQDYHNPRFALSDVAHSSPPDFMSDMNKDLIDTSFLPNNLFECTGHVSVSPPPTTAVDDGRQGRSTLSRASSCQEEQWELDSLKKLMIAPENHTGHEADKRQGNVFSSKFAAELRSNAGIDNLVVMPVPDIPVRKLEVEQHMSEPIPSTIRATSMQGVFLDLNSNAGSIESPSGRSNSIMTGHSTTPSISTASSGSITKQQSHWSPVSPIAARPQEPPEICVDDHLGMIVFNDVPKIQLQDRIDWPLPASKAPDAQSLRTFLLEDANDVNGRGESANSPKISAQSEVALGHSNLRRRRTGFIMQRRSSSIASLHSYRTTKGAEVPGPAMMLLRNARRAPSSSETTNSRSGTPTPLKNMFSVAGSVTRRFHLQRDDDDKRSTAVMTPVSETFDMLTGGVGSEGRISGETLRPKLKADFISKSRLRWEFRGGIVGQD